MHKQLTVQGARHKLAREICHGKKGTIHQAYRDPDASELDEDDDGQEGASGADQGADQLARCRLAQPLRGGRGPLPRSTRL